MSQTNSLPSSTADPIEASTISRRLSVLDPRMQRIELLRNAKLIFVLRYDMISANGRIFKFEAILRYGDRKLTRRFKTTDTKVYGAFITPPITICLT